MKCVYIDDEQESRDILREIINNYRVQNGIQIDLQCYDKPVLLSYDLKDRIFYDLYLLDIELRCNQSGLDLAALIREYDKNAKIVFLTSYADYALRGYQYHPFHYILKKNLNELEDVLNWMIQDREEEKDHFRLVKNRYGIEKIRYMDLCYIYKKGKNSIYVCRDGGTCFERKTLVKVGEEIPAPEMLMVGKSYMINMNRIRRVDGQKVVFDCQVEPVYIPYQQVEFVKKSLFQFLKGGQP